MRSRKTGRGILSKIRKTIDEEHVLRQTLPDCSQMQERHALLVGRHVSWQTRSVQLKAPFRQTHVLQFRMTISPSSQSSGQVHVGHSRQPRASSLFHRSTHPGRGARVEGETHDSLQKGRDGHTIKSHTGHPTELLRATKRQPG